MIYWVQVVMICWSWQWCWCRAGFCEKRSEIAPVLNTASSSQPQNGPATGHSWADQPIWWSLGENVFKKGNNAMQQLGVDGWEWESPVNMKVKRRRRGGDPPGAEQLSTMQCGKKTMLKQISTVQTMENPMPQGGRALEEAAAHGVSLLEQASGGTAAYG